MESTLLLSEPLVRIWAECNSPSENRPIQTPDSQYYGPCRRASKRSVSLTEEGGSKREFSSNFKPTFYPCTVLRQPRPLPEGALSRGSPTGDCIVYYRMGGVRGDNSFVYDFYALAARWTGHAKISKQLTDLTVLLKKSLL